MTDDSVLVAEWLSPSSERLSHTLAIPRQTAKDPAALQIVLHHAQQVASHSLTSVDDRADLSEITWTVEPFALTCGSCHPTTP